MFFKDINNCPLCDSDNSSLLLSLDCKVFDHSSLYKTIRLKSCSKCGHVYNQLSAEELAGLNSYYCDEYALINVITKKKSVQKDVPVKYRDLLSFIDPYITNKSRIIDIGCGTGDFLSTLHQHGIDDIHGIDMIPVYTEYASHSGLPIKCGMIEDSEYESNSFSFAVVDQVLEHVSEPHKTLSAINKILKEEGYLCIGVPDAERYNDLFFFDYYWLLLREHIQHYDIHHMLLLLQMRGFKFIDSKATEYEEVPGSMIIPNRYYLFQKTNHISEMVSERSPFELHKKMKEYIGREFLRLQKRRDEIVRIINEKKEIYLWGIGRECMYYINNSGLNFQNITGLIDKNEYKQKNLKINGMGISNTDILKSASASSVVIITSVAHTGPISSELERMGYQGEIFKLA